jgi:Raf kinase inhibitor-like YbhB/YbcL family protein
MRRHLVAIVSLVAVACSSSSSDTPASSGGTSGQPPAPPGVPPGTPPGTPPPAPPPIGDAGPDAPSATLALTSTAFAGGAAIPQVHSCDGTSESPPLAWTGAPAGTQSFAIVTRDLSLAAANNYHWVIYDIPAATTSLPQNVQKAAAPATPAGAKQTPPTFSGTPGYTGPCPPKGNGAHNYQFAVYAFSTPTIAVAAGATAMQADAVIQAQKTAGAILVGTYQR